MAVKEFAVIDCRVSDPQQLKGGSLTDQEAAGRYFANKEGWEVDRVFRKPHSATTNEREDIDIIIDYIKKRKRDGVNITKYILKTLDRFTRMGGEEYWQLKRKLEEIGVDLVDATGIIQPKRNSLEHLGEQFKYSWSVYSPSEAAETMEAYKGKAEVRDILTRLVGAEIKLVLDGYAVRQAPDGLKNSHILVDGKKKVVRTESDRAHYFKKMFELRAEGMDDQQICDRLNAEGFRTRQMHRWDRSDKEHPRVVGKKGGKPLTVKQLQRYVLQTEYVGIAYEKWTQHHPIRMQGFEGIISVDEYNRANRGKRFIQVHSDGSIEILHNYSPWGRVKHLRDNPKYPWKIIPCPVCRSEMTASASTGKLGKKFPAYHCGGLKKNPKRNHPYFRVAQATFEENIERYFDNLRFKKGFMAGLELHLLNKYRTREKEVLTESSAISRGVADLKAELAQKLDAFTLAKTDSLRNRLEESINNLEQQITKAENERGKIEITEKSIRAFRHYAEYLMEHPAELIKTAENMTARRALMSLFFEEIPTYQEILNGTPKLQPLFRLSEEFKVDKNQLVTLRGFEPRFNP